MKLKPLLKLHLLLILWVAMATGLSAQTFKNGQKQGAIRVKMNEMLQANLKSIKTTRKGVETGIVAFDAVSEQVATHSMKRVFRYSPKFEERHKAAGLHLWYEIEFDNSLNPEEVARQYGQLSEVSIASIIPEVKLIGEQASPEAFTSNATVAFDDPYLSDQWHYDNDGTAGEWAVEGADINLSKAWEIETGSSDVIVAIIDGGVQYDHPDLEAAMWTNDLELNGIEGIDDDGNGFVDDIYGYNFCQKKGEIVTHYHGTHVAGTVGAINNNGKGVAGVAGGNGSTPGVRLMSCQIFTEDGAAGGYAEAIIYAADMGAVIGQNSWGWSADGVYDPVVLEAIDYFNANAGSYAGSPMKGGVSIFAAGNLGFELDIYPAAYEPCIAVASIGPDYKRAPYSVFADWVDISAPGGNTTNFGSEGGIMSTYRDGGYAYLQGTSMACPHVSGIAALVVSKFKGPDFTADQLKQHILTSVHDIEQFQTEEHTVGKLGNGYIDAWMALQSGDPSIVPNRVNDLVAETAQDFATLFWTVVPDADDEKAVSYNVYWSKEPFTEANIQTAGSTVVNEFFAKVGDEITYTIKDLDAQTDYYFAIKAFDRWGNGSELSDVLKAKTNNGPEVVMGGELSFDIDVKNNTTTSQTYSFSNVGEGVLNWKAHIGLDSLSLTPFAQNTVSYPNFQSAPSLSGVGSEGLVIDAKIAAPFYESIDERMRYVDFASSATKIIGENDTTITNSAATWYKVEEKEGFNLTHMWLNMRVNPKTGPVVIEVWKGSILREAELISAQNFMPKTDIWTTHYVQLEEQIHFDQGDVYWTVIHIPSGNLYPLGIQEEKEEHFSERCFMSFNGGASWEPLASVINQDKYVWSWSMRSTMNDLGNYISLTPNEGVLKSSESQDLTVDLDAANLIDGYYEENIVIKSNDPKQRIARGKIKFNVSGHEPKLNSVKTVDFGNVFVGASLTFDIQITNEGLRGYQLLENGYSSSQPDVFIADAVVSGETIPAQAEGWVRVTFAPTAEGVFNGTITLNNDQGYKHEFSVHGIAVIPANIVINDTEQGGSEVLIPGDLTVGDAIANRTFTIANDGKYPLHYKVPKFAPDYEVEGLDKPINNFGYTYDYVLTNQHPEGATTADKIAAHNWEDISADGVRVDEALRGPEYAYETEIGFSFPFRDRFYNKVWINEQGALVFDEDGNKNLDYVSGSTVSNPSWLRDFDMICATMMSPEYSDNSRIFYRQEEGMFRVFYKNLKYGAATVGVDLQIVLHASGDVDILFYKSIYSASFLIGIVDKENADVAFIHNSDYPVLFSKGDNSNAYHDYFHFYHPGENMITNVTNPSGTVQPGESIELEVSFSTDGVLQDAIYERMAIVSNDPDLPLSKYTVNANFVAGGKAALVSENTVLDFGEVFKTDNVEIVTLLTNSGTADIQLTDIQIAGSNQFSTAKIAELPLLVKARQSVHIPVKINTGIQSEPAAGLLEDLMTITDELGATYDIALIGQVVENPIIRVTPEAGISHTLNAGETYETQITVFNDGDGELEYAIVPTNWYYLKDDASATSNAFKEFDYVHAKGDGAGWRDITESAAHTNLESKFFDEDLPYFTLPLDKSYPYYGEKYDTLYIGLMGWATFIKPEVEHWSKRPNMIPSEDGIPGLIAPMAAFHVPYYYSRSQKQGIYYQEEVDRVIVSWEDYFPVAGGRLEYSFQLIIHENGAIDFNYRNLDNPSVFPIIGLENPNQSDGLLVWFDYMPSDQKKMSFTVSPVQKKRIAPQSSEVVKLVLDASSLYDGVYNSQLHVRNNAVGEEDVLIPMELTVNGTPKVEAIGNNAGQVWYVEGKTYDKAFTIKNTGTKTVYLKSGALTTNPEISVSYLHDPVYNRFGWVVKEAGLIPLTQFVGKEVYYNAGRQTVLIADGTALAPGDEWNMVMHYSPASPAVSTSILTLTDTDLAEAFNCELSIESKMPPSITISDEIITVSADVDTYTTTHDLVIGNVNGSGDLEWNIALVFNRGKEIDLADVNSSLKATLKTAPLTQGNAVTNNNKLKSALASEYNRSVSYTDATAKNNNIGFGPGLSFISGTKFKAPADGFLLSHVETFYVRESVLNGVITAEIKAGGNNINDAITVGRGQLSLNFDSADPDVGEFVTIELDESIYIYPNEHFYVVFTYPFGITKPQGVVYTDKENIVSDRFFFNYQGDWFDMYTQGGFQDMVFMVRAHELNYEQKTWLSIDAANMAGITTVGNSTTIPLNFSATNAQEIRNNAQLMIFNNDPLNDTMLVDVNLLMNEAPFVELVEGNQKVDEMQSATLRFKVSDMEGDAFSNEVIADQDWISFDDNTSDITVVASPDYSAQGIHSIEIISTDEHGVARSTQFEIQVINVNRAPVFSHALTDTTVVWEHGDFEIDFNKVITDVDNDKMTYGIEVENEEVLELLYNSGRAILKPVMIGTTNVHLSGRDAYGASVEGTYAVTVVNRTAIDPFLDASIEIYPNPVIENLTVNWGNVTDETSIKIIDVQGQTVHHEQVSGQETHTLNVSDLSAGVYVLELSDRVGVKVQKFVKK